MIAPYLPRLLALCCAVFFAVHFAAGLMVSAAGPAAVRAARRLCPRSAARRLLWLRLLPTALGLFAVAGICLPSYLWLEPADIAEEIGPGCLLAAALAVALWTISLVRGLRAGIRSIRHTRESGRLSRLWTLPGTGLQVCIVDTPAPLLALVGLYGSRVIVSNRVMQAFAAPQLLAALHHEEAHRVSRDNMKRLLMLLTPGLLPGFHGFRTIERGWARFTEWAADDDAVRGDADQSLTLAAALVCVARMGATPAPSPLGASFLGNGGEISARVERLLNPTPPAPVRRPRNAPAAAIAVAAAGCLLHPATLQWAHRTLERLIH